MVVVGNGCSREDSKILQAYWKEPKPFCESLKANFSGVEYEWKDILFWRVHSETVSPQSDTKVYL